jgi:hypothetical protein
MENYTKKEVSINGDICYYNSKRLWHRTDGPAVEYANGSNAWLLYGKHHRLDGPSCVWRDGHNYWHINNRLYTKTEHNRLVLFSILEPQRIDLNPTEVY